MQNKTAMFSNVDPICYDLGIEQKTTFWMDFSIADRFGDAAIKDTFNRAFKEWRTDYIYLTELVMTLNHKVWIYYQKNPHRAELYQELWEKADAWAQENLKGDELAYYYEILD